MNERHEIKHERRIKLADRGRPYFSGRPGFRDPTITANVLKNMVVFYLIRGYSHLVYLDLDYKSRND